MTTQTVSKIRTYTLIRNRVFSIEAELPTATLELVVVTGKKRRAHVEAAVTAAFEAGETDFWELRKVAFAAKKEVA